MLGYAYATPLTKLSPLLRLIPIPGGDFETAFFLFLNRRNYDCLMGRKLPDHTKPSLKLAELTYFI